MMSDARAVYRAHPTSEEIDEVLGQRLKAALGTVNEDGSIHLVYVIFLYEAGRFYVETSSLTRKARNAAARAQATLLVDGQAASGRSVMVAVEGTASVISGDAARDLNHRLRAKYIKAEALDSIDRAWGQLDDVSIEIIPGTWRSWTGAALHAETQKHLDVPYADIWRE